MWFDTVPVFFGLILDLIFGDPHYFFHPVRIIGWFIYKLEIFLRKIFPETFAWEKLAGTLLALIIVGGTFVLTSVVLNIFLSINYLFAIILSSVMVYIGISVKDMKVSAMRIYNALLNSDIEKARIETA
ncbi:MAG: cobalamin biosynthesis protein, partial [Candidatus Firestonebacteria bacterium]